MNEPDEMPRQTMDDFSALIDAQLNGYRNGFDPGERLDAVVIQVTPTHLVIDVNAKREGLVPIEECRDETGEVAPSPGDAIEVWFVGMQSGAFLFSTKLSSAAAVQRSLAGAFADGMPVEGVVTEEIKGGYSIDIAGTRAFCPFSQMALHRVEGAEYVGKRMSFMVSEFDREDGGNVVLSRRALLEREREAERDALAETLAVGDVRDGTVTRLTDFGVFVDIGGAEGLVPLGELAWKRGLRPEDVVAAGDRVRVAVREIDWERNRISLSLREAEDDPWPDAAQRFPPGSSLRGAVSRLERFGAFVEVLPGVEGLIPIGRLAAGRRIQHPREVVEVGQELELRVESVDPAARRMSLTLIDPRLSKTDPEALAPGAEIEGVVEGIKEFGVFVRLSERKTGLLHVSELSVGRVGAQAKLERLYPPGSSLKVTVKAIEGTRVALTLPERWAAERENDAGMAAYRDESQGNKRVLGNLGDMLDSLNL